MDLIKYNYHFLILSCILYKKKKYNSPIIVPQISFQDITKSSKHFEESRENSCFNRGRFGRRTQVTKGNRCHGGARLRANRWTINRRLHGDNGNAVNLEAHSRRIAATNYDPPPPSPRRYRLDNNGRLILNRGTLNYQGRRDRGLQRRVNVIQVVAILILSRRRNVAAAHSTRDRVRIVHLVLITDFYWWLPFHSSIVCSPFWKDIWRKEKRW